MNATVSALTPNYVLLDGKTRIAPSVLPLRSGRTCVCLYGFSDKAPYDRFRGNSAQPLTPFPLVKVYLRTLLELGQDSLHLVIVDAVGPKAEKLSATTMEAVLEAQIAQNSSAVAEYSLTLDPDTNTYRIDE